MFSVNICLAPVKSPVTKKRGCADCEDHRDVITSQISESGSLLLEVSSELRLQHCSGIPKLNDAGCKQYNQRRGLQTAQSTTQAANNTINDAGCKQDTKNDAGCKQHYRCSSSIGGRRCCVTPRQIRSFVGRYTST